jgi:hypothetical protein
MVLCHCIAMKHPQQLLVLVVNGKGQQPHVLWAFVVGVQCCLYV